MIGFWLPKWQEFGKWVFGVSAPGVRVEHCFVEWGRQSTVMVGERLTPEPEQLLGSLHAVRSPGCSNYMGSCSQGGSYEEGCWWG